MKTFVALLTLILNMSAVQAEANLVFNSPTKVYTCGATQSHGKLFKVQDIDQDGHTDIVYESCIFWGNGRAEFLQTYQVSKNRVVIAVGDFNGDRKFDLITCNSVRAYPKSLNCSVQLQLKNRKFSAEVAISGLGQLPQEIIEQATVTDLIGDQRSDLVIVVRQVQRNETQVVRLLAFPNVKNKISVFDQPVEIFSSALSDIAGNFSAVGYGVLESARLQNITDKKYDLAVAFRQSPHDSDPVKIFLNQGSYKFKPALFQNKAGQQVISPQMLKSVRWSQNQPLGLVLSDEGGISDFPGWIVFIKNVSAGVFRYEAISSAMVNHNESLDVSHLNQKGTDYILISGGSDHQFVYLYQISSDGKRFDQKMSIPTHQNTGAFFGDFNNDLKIDIVTDVSLLNGFSGISIITSK